MSNQGYIHGLHRGVELNRMVATFPINKRPINIYLPISTQGSVNQLDSTEVEYSKEIDYIGFEGVITNIDNYQDSETVYESFEKELYLLKYLSTVEDAILLPDGAKLVVLDEKNKGYKTFILQAKSEIKSAVGKVMSVQYEITPIYLMNDADSIVLRAENILEEIEQGAVVPQQTIDLEEDDIDSIEEQDINDDGVATIPTEGGLYFE